MTRAALYLRLSKDTSGEAENVGVQRLMCERLAEQLGFEVVKVFTDNDTSAYSGKRRPGFEALLEAIETGQVDAVVTRHVDRLYRRSADLVRYVDVCQKADVPTHTVLSGPLDLTTATGKLQARVSGVFAEYEAEAKGERQRLMNAARAKRGAVALVRRPFGYDLTIEHVPGSQHTRRTLTPREPEAEALRWGFEVLLSGGSLGEIAREWNRRELYGPQTGRPWAPATVGRTLRLPRLAGLVTYQGDIVRDEAGHPVVASWPAIIDQDTFWAAQAVLSDPKRRFTPKFVAPFLLSGVAVCDICGAKINSGGTRRGAGGVMQRRLRCSAKGGHVYRAAELVEEFVETELLAHLAAVDPGRFEVPKQGVDVAALRAQVAELHTRGEALTALFADGTLNADELRAGKARLAERLQAIEDQVASASEPSSALKGLVTALDVGRYWERLTLEQRRQVVRETVEVRLRAPGTKENARRWLEAEYDADGGLVRQAGWYCNPETVVLNWKI